MPPSQKIERASCPESRSGELYTLALTQFLRCFRSEWYNDIREKLKAERTEARHRREKGMAEGQRSAPFFGLGELLPLQLAVRELSELGLQCVSSCL